MKRSLPLSWFWAGIFSGVLTLMLLSLLSGCAFRYDKQAGGYTGAIGCVDVTGPGFTWKCTEQSTPTLPDSQKPPTP